MLLPKISILVPVYNHDHFIRGALDSILADPYPNKEIVIIDDGSSDRSDEIVRAWLQEQPSHEQISYLSRPNKGITATLNELIRKASGDFLRLFSSDDLLSPGSLGEMAAILIAKPQKSAVAGDCVVIDENDVETSASVIRTNGGNPARMAQKPLLAHEIISRWSIGGPCILIRKSFYELNGYYNETMRIDDWDLYLRLVASNQLTFINKIVARYRIHSANTCRTTDIPARTRNLNSQMMAGQFRLPLFSGSHADLLNAEIRLLNAKVSYLQHRYVSTALTLVSYLGFKLKSYLSLQ